ncbi:MAG: hypothetical protein KBT35_03690 [Firmicutes bacterium]|nr:hypothetical protein [Candidatus Colivicinus equi]
MDYLENDKLDYTNMAWESLYETVDDIMFKNMDAKLIYNSLEKKLKFISFGDYLKRYIYRKAELDIPFEEVTDQTYQQIIRYSFSDNSTPQSFEITSAKLSALSKNWLNQKTVKRKVVFILGFGLNMSVDDVNMFLTKALREPGINPKDPFEVICWYCYKNGYGFHKYEKLWDIYCNNNIEDMTINVAYSDYTIGLRSSMQSINDEYALMLYLTRLKVNGNTSFISMTTKDCFMKLYDESRELIAKLYNETEDDNKTYTKDDITESDFEKIICAAIPVDRHGNLTPSKASSLNEQFQGRRFSRQHIGEVLTGKSDISRFDLITLNFFIFSQRAEEYDNANKRFTEFLESTNNILLKCYMGKLYVQNPYECFVLMCILSEDPLGTYADVWELSYIK